MPLVLQAQQNGVFFQKSLLIDQFHNLMRLQRALLLQYSRDHLSHSPRLESLLAKTVDAAAHENEALIFDKFVVHRLNVRRLRINAVASNVSRDIPEVKRLRVFFEHKVGLVADRPRLNLRRAPQTEIAKNIHAESLGNVQIVALREIVTSSEIVRVAGAGILRRRLQEIHHALHEIEKFIFKNFNSLMKKFPSIDSVWKELNNFRSKHGHKRLSMQKHRLVEYNEAVFYKSIKIHPVAIFGYRKEARMIAKKCNLPHFRSAGEFYEKSISNSKLK